MKPEIGDWYSNPDYSHTWHVTHVHKNGNVDIKLHNRDNVQKYGLSDINMDSPDWTLNKNSIAVFNRLVDEYYKSA